jgi:hypothetical protein
MAIGLVDHAARFGHPCRISNDCGRAGSWWGEGQENLRLSKDLVFSRTLQY